MKKTLALLTVALLLVFIGPQFVSLHRFGQFRDQRTPSAGSILVGVAWPFASNQDGLDDGLLMAQEEINAAGGAGGKRIELLLRDDQMDVDQSRSLAIDFARNTAMVATIGYYDDKLAVRASAIFEESHLLHIVVGANNTFMTTHGFRYLIRSVLSNERLGRKLARLCLDRGYHSFALVGEDGAFGEDFVYQFGNALDAENATVVYRSSFVPGRIDFRDTVEELRVVPADAILFAGLEAEAAQFIKTARSIGLKTPIVGTFSDTPEVRAIAGAALEGVMFYDIYDVDSPTPENRAFVARYQKRFGRHPEAYAAQGYDALRLLAKAANATGSANPLDLAYSIRSMRAWEGANGTYKFDQAGEMGDKAIVLKVFRGTQPVVLATSRPD